RARTSRWFSDVLRPVRICPGPCCQICWERSRPWHAWPRSVARGCSGLVQRGRAVTAVVLLKRRRLGMRTLSGAIARAALVSVSAAGQVAVVVERIQDLDLTDAQETKIAEIRKQHQPKVQAAAKELGTFLKEEDEKIRGVLTAEQQKQIQAMK